MTKPQLTGTRIRERRGQLGLRQGELALRVGISASYLNLIEHNRRRIGGKLLNAIAQVLEVEPAALSEGAETTLLAALEEARAALPDVTAATEPVQDFAGRFPGWAEVLVRTQRRVTVLERAVETLSDRLTHDPQLGAALHDVLSTVTAIRATAGILADTRTLEPEWRDRFHRNINEDAARLADRAQALVTYLDRAAAADSRGAQPEEELEAFLAVRDWRFEPLESGEAEIDTLVAGASELRSARSRSLAADWLRRYAADAAALPLAALRAALAAHGPDPAQVAQVAGVTVPLAMRRLATLPDASDRGAVGMVSCDASGTLVFRRPVEGFALPRLGAACPWWPLFAAQGQPGVPLRRHVRQAGRDGGVFLAYALSQAEGAIAFGQPPRFQTHMLLVPVGLSGVEEVDEVGSSCRVCPRAVCSARREPSILSDGF